MARREIETIIFDMGREKGHDNWFAYPEPVARFLIKKYKQSAGNVTFGMEIEGISLTQVCEVDFKQMQHTNINSGRVHKIRVVMKDELVSYSNTFGDLIFPADEVDSSIDSFEPPTFDLKRKAGKDKVTAVKNKLTPVKAGKIDDNDSEEWWDENEEGSSSEIGVSEIGASGIGASDIGASGIGSSNLGASSLGASDFGSSNLAPSNPGSSIPGSSNSGSPKLTPSKLGVPNISKFGSKLGSKIGSKLGSLKSGASTWYGSSSSGSSSLKPSSSQISGLTPDSNKFVVKPILKNCKPSPIFGSGSSSPDSKCKKKNLNIVWDLDESKPHPERMMRHQPTSGNGTSNTRNRAGVSSNQYETAGSRFDHGEVRKCASRADIIESIMVETCKKKVKLHYPLPVLNLLRKYYTMGLDECTFSLVCYEVKPKQAVQTYNVNFKTLEQTNVASGKKKKITIVPNGSKITYDPTSVIRCTLTGEREEMCNIEWRRKHGADTSCERTPVTRKMDLQWKYQENGSHETFNTSFSNGSVLSHATKESWPPEADNALAVSHDTRSLSPKHSRSLSPTLSIPKIGQRDLLTPKSAGTPRSAGRSPRNGFLGLKSGASSPRKDGSPGSSPRKDESPVLNTYVFKKLGLSNKSGVALSEGGRSKSRAKDQFLRVDRSGERSKSQDRSLGKSASGDKFLRVDRSQERSKSQDRSRGKSPSGDKLLRVDRSQERSKSQDRSRGESPSGDKFLRVDRSKSQDRSRGKSPNGDKLLRVDRSQERSKSQDRSRGKSPSRSKSPGGSRELSQDRDRKRQDGLSKSPKNDRDHTKSPRNNSKRK